MCEGMGLVIERQDLESERLPKRRGDGETRRQGDWETGRQGDREIGRRGDGET